MPRQSGSARVCGATSRMAAATASAWPGAAWKRAKMVSVIGLPGEFGDPVSFPGLAAVVGERLLEPEGPGGDIREDEAHEDGSVVQGFLVVELAAAVLEAARHGDAQLALGAVGEGDAPLVRGRVVYADAHAFDVACGPVQLQFADVGLAVPPGPYDRRPVVLDPGVGAGERMQTPRQMALPVAELEIEIVRPTERRRDGPGGLAVGRRGQQQTAGDECAAKGVGEGFHGVKAPI